MRKLTSARVWSVFFVGAALRVLPERFKGQHRAGDLVIWASSFPRG
jgi:hypothetical protein